MRMNLLSCEVCNFLSIYWRDAKKSRNCFVKCKHQVSCLSNQLYVFRLIKSSIMIESIQFVFTTKERINCYSRRDENTIIQIDRRREIDFNISQNDENNVDSSLDFLHVEISIKRVLQDIIATINNQFAKKKKTFQKHEKQIAFRFIVANWFQCFFICFSTFCFCNSFNSKR